MTIVVSFLTPEGVVLGTDSATTFLQEGGGERYLNHAQKIFQVDDAGSLGVSTYGNAGMFRSSIRTAVALLSDRFSGAHVKPPTVEAAAVQLQGIVTEIVQAEFAGEIARATSTQQRATAGTAPTPEDARHLIAVQAAFWGFHVGGRNLDDRAPALYNVRVVALGTSPPPQKLGMGWATNGSDGLAMRILRGWNPEMISAVTSSENVNGVKRWAGSTADDLQNALGVLGMVVNPLMPIREAVDFVHLIVTLTSKMTKFAQLPPNVGGPAEVAVITTDRPFRWVRHKEFDSAL